jgi:acetyl esterase/lipase
MYIFNPDFLTYPTKPINMIRFAPGVCLFLLTITYSMNATAQTPIPLYGTQPIPNSKPTPNEESSSVEGGILRIEKVSRPTLTIYMPPSGTSALARPTATGRTAIVICPGGGYHILAAAHEGSDFAKRFADSGLVAIVLHYRIPDDSTMVDKTIGPLQDAQRAIQYVREHADSLGVDPHKVGIMGFSAGGHLASTEGTHYQHSYIPNPHHTSLRPDFMILGYPVISFNDSTGHRGSRDQLIGVNPPKDSILKYSNELQVTRHTPPTFLVHAKDDKTVPVVNSIDFAAALKAHHVPSELYLYEQGGHGFGMHNPSSTVDWFPLALAFIHEQGF